MHDQTPGLPAGPNRAFVLTVVCPASRCGLNAHWLGRDSHSHEASKKALSHASWFFWNVARARRHIVIVHSASEQTNRDSQEMVWATHS